MLHALYQVEGKCALPLAVYHCYCHYHLLPLTTGFAVTFAYPDCFFSWLREIIASYTAIHSGCPITIALHRCAFIINYTYTSTINQLKHRFVSGSMEKITLGRGLEPNIALGYASCYISLSTVPSCYFFHIALAAVL